MTPFVPSGRSKLKRLPKRARYDRETVYAILDGALVCHLGYAIGGQPLAAGAPQDDPRLSPGAPRPAGLASLAHLGIR